MTKMSRMRELIKADNDDTVSCLVITSVCQV